MHKTFAVSHIYIRILHEHNYQQCTQLRGNIDLSSYEVRDLNLHKLGLLENIGRKIMDCISSVFSSEARYAIASRNAEVARKVADLMLSTTNQTGGPQNLASAQRVTHQGIEALKTKLSNAHVGAPQRQAAAAFLDSIQQQIDGADAEAIQELSDGLESIEKILFTHVAGHSSTALNKSFADSMKAACMRGSATISLGKLQDAFASGLTLSLDGTKVDGDSGEDALSNQLKNFLGDDYEKCVPIFTECFTPYKIEVWGGRNLPNSTGEWRPVDLGRLGIVTNMENLAVSVAKGDDGYTVNIRADIGFENRSIRNQHKEPLPFIKQDFTTRFHLGQKNIDMLSGMMSHADPFHNVIADTVAQQHRSDLGAHVSVNHKLE